MKGGNPNTRNFKNKIHTNSLVFIDFIYLFIHLDLYILKILFEKVSMQESTRWEGGAEGQGEGDSPIEQGA